MSVCNWARKTCSTVTTACMQISLNWQVQDIPAIEWLDPHSALQILRIVQEVLANAVKHAHADTVTLRTGTRGDHVVVVIEDNGIGFDASRPQTHGRGLTNVQRRAQTIGAQASWTAQQVGTRFELALPLAQPLAGLLNPSQVA